MAAGSSAPEFFSAVIGALTFQLKVVIMITFGNIDRNGVFGIR